MPLEPALDVGLCIDNKGVGIGAIGDPHLIAVEDIVVTLPFWR